MVIHSYGVRTDTQMKAATNVHAHMHTHAHAHGGCTNAHTQKHTYLHTYTHKGKGGYMDKNTDTHIHTQMNISLRLHTHTYIHVCLYTQIHKPENTHGHEHTHRVNDDGSEVLFSAHSQNKLCFSAICYRLLHTNESAFTSIITPLYL